MSRRNKLLKFEEILSFPNVYENHDLDDDLLVAQPNEKVDMKGKWNSDHFKNDQPLILELACGGGEYTVNLAQIYPDNNYIGIDLKGNRIWKGASKALALKVDNAAFIRTRIEFMRQFFDKNEVDEIWITFPDPFLKTSKSNRRLTSPYFLNIYRDIIKPGAIIHLKTDDDVLYKFTLDTIKEDEKATLLYANDDIYAQELVNPVLDIKTHYERMHLANKLTIKYIKFKIN